MREIKFRAWDKVKKKFIRGAHALVKFNGDVFYLDIPKPTPGECTLTHLSKPEQDDFILMQYTGLKDCKGKEIYEGDVLRYDCWYHPEGKITHEGEIRFNMGNGAFGVEYGDGEFHYFGSMVYESACEIIGNIYENSEYKH